MHACRTILAVTIVAVTACQMNAAVAQGFPSRPITVVVPFPAGGPLDVLARVMSERMRQALGQPLVIENVGGAGGTVGVGRVARASPDGYALCLGYRIRYVLDMNAREAMHVCELRSGREGHPTYRAVAQAMHEQISAVHPAIGAAMRHVDSSSEPRLERIMSEIRTHRKQQAAAGRAS